MQSSYRIFRIFGISVELHITFLLFLLVLFPIYWFSYGIISGAGMIVLFALLFAIVLMHELMHSIVARMNEIEVSRIILLPIGGLASIEIPEKPKIELMVSAAGPLLNFALAAFFMIILILTVQNPIEVLSEARGHIEPSGIGSVVFNFPGILSLLIWINLMLGLFNILPGFPMDGGRVLRSLLAFWMDYTKATRIAVTIGQIIFIVMIILGIFSGDFWIIIIGIFLFYAGSNELQIVRLKNALRGLKIGQIAIRGFSYVHESATIQDFMALIAMPGQRYYPVVNIAGKIIGIVDMQDLRDLRKENFGRITVGDIAVKRVNFIDADLNAEDIVTNLLTIDFVLVIDKGSVIGYLTPEHLMEIARFHGIFRKE